MGAAANSAARGFSCGSRQGSARQHSILGGYPSFPVVPQEGWYRFFDGCGADDSRISNLDENRAFSGRNVLRMNMDRTKLVRRAMIATIEHEQILAAEGS